MPVELVIEDGIQTRLYGGTRNLGLGGTCVVVSVPLLYREAQVLVRFTGGRGSRRKFPATVVWVSGNAAGLMFDDTDGGTLQALWRLLLQHRRAAHGSALAIPR